MNALKVRPTDFTSQSFLNRQGKRKAMMQLTSSYVNPVRNGSLSMLEGWSTLTDRLPFWIRLSYRPVVCAILILYSLI